MSLFSTPNLNEKKRKTVLQLKDFRLKVQQHFLLFNFKSPILNYGCAFFTSVAKVFWQWTENTGHLCYFQIKQSILTTFCPLKEHGREKILVLIYFQTDHNVLMV